MSNETVPTGGITRRISELWLRDGWPTLRLASPVMVARAGIVLMFVVDSLMAGTRGGLDLAFLGQGLAAQSIMMLISIGLLQGSMVLISQAYGAGELHQCGQTWRSAVVVAASLGVFFGLCCLFVGPALLWSGLDPALAEGADRVSRQFAWGMPPMLVYICSGYFLESIKKPSIGMMIMISANVLNVIADGIVVLGWFSLLEPMGADGAVMTTSALRWLICIAIVSFILRLPEARDLGLFEPLHHVPQRIIRMLTIGAPISIALGLETAAVSSLSFMAGHLGAAPAAAHQLTFNFNGLMIMAAVGLSAASAVRVGHAVGAGDHTAMQRAGLTGIVLAVIVMSLFGLLVALFARTISEAYVQDPEVWAISVSTLRAIGIMIIVDGVMTVTMGVLRGMGDVRWPAFMHGVAFWVVGVPVAYWLAFPGQMGAVGLILGISLAMLVSLILLGLRFRHAVQHRVSRA